MKLLFELSWLWESIAIIALVITVCEVCALLICKARKQKLSKRRQLSLPLFPLWQPVWQLFCFPKHRVY